MAIENSDHWFLKKYENGEVFGPIPFTRIAEWARSAQVNYHDMVSTDQVIWNKAPMIPELKMDWLVVVGDELLYGPTTAEALLEFYRRGEITVDHPLINCLTAQKTILGDTDFYREAPPLEPEPPVATEEAEEAPVRGQLRLNLQQRIRELEGALLDKRREMRAAQATITRLEERVRELEGRIRDFSGLKTS